MPLPPKTNAVVIQRFGELLAEADRVLQHMNQENTRELEAYRREGNMIAYELHVSETDFFSLRTSFLSLVEYMSSVNNNLRRVADEVTALESKISDMRKLKGFILG